MNKNKLLFCVLEWRFNRYGKSFDECIRRVRAAEPLSKTKKKYLDKASRILHKRKRLLDHMYPLISK